MYEELRRLQIEEKRSNDLVQVKEDTYSRAFIYIEQLKTQLASKWDTQTVRELENCSKVLHDIEIKRTEKIIWHAFNEIYNGFPPLTGLTDQEKALYYEVKEAVRRFKEGIDKREFKSVEPREDVIKIKVLKDVPKFKALDGNEYGPFPAGARCELPKKEGEIMIKRNLAELVE
ncbi:MAG: hypothetical protein QXS93_04710 [Candidatus Micrarchaeia archaeon]